MPTAASAWTTAPAAASRSDAGKSSAGQEVKADADTGAVVVDDGGQAGERGAGVLLEVSGGEGSEDQPAGQALAGGAGDGIARPKSMRVGCDDRLPETAGLHIEREPGPNHAVCRRGSARRRPWAADHRRPPVHLG